MNRLFIFGLGYSGRAVANAARAMVTTCPERHGEDRTKAFGSIAPNRQSNRRRTC